MCFGLGSSSQASLSTDVCALLPSVQSQSEQRLTAEKLLTAEAGRDSAWGEGAMWKH